jgi:hypothetical protein
MRSILPLLALLLAAAPAGAQARYRPQPDTLFYEGMNPFHMYAVRGGDTLGLPVRAFSVRRQVWRDSAGLLVVRERSDEVQVRGSTRWYSGRFTPRGVPVLAPGEGGALDRLTLPLRLPADGDLREGRVWHDTVDDNRPTVDGGEYVYQLSHELRVERVADTLGARMALVRGTGRLRYRQAAGPDSAGGPGWWMDVTGPVDETFLFDLDAGRLAGREWWMDLRGVSGLPDGAGGADTVPAGLLSKDTTRLVSAERARRVGRDLPVGDTTVTAAAQGDILLHTVRREGPSIESAFRLNDGTTMSVRARHEDGRAVRYALLHTSPHGPVLERTVELRDTTLALPEGAWTVSDGGMDEHLAPALARMAADGEDEGEIAILRPFTLEWTRAQVQVFPVEDAYAALLLTEPDGIRDARMILFVTKEGDLLYAEGEDFARRPPPGSEALKRVNGLILALQEMARGQP